MRSQTSHSSPQSHAGTCLARTLVLVAAALPSWACGSLDEHEELWPNSVPEPPPRSGAARAIAFDGESHYATTGTAGFPFALAPHAIALWVRPARLEGVQNIVVLRKDFGSGVQLGLQDGLLMAWRVYGGRPFVTSPEPLETGKWYHIGYVYDGAEHHLYVDGVEQATGNLEPNNRTTTTAWLGSLDGRSEFFAGALTHVRVWNEAKSASEIASDASGEPVSNSGLVLDLPFDEPEGLRAFDHSGRGNHAALGDGFSEWAPERVEGVGFP